MSCKHDPDREPIKASNVDLPTSKLLQEASGGKTAITQPVEQLPPGCILRYAGGQLKRVSQKYNKLTWVEAVSAAVLQVVPAPGARA